MRLLRLPTESGWSRNDGGWRNTMAQFGYAGEILVINLSDNKVTKLPTDAYADRFLGGRGIAAKLYWDMVPPHATAFDAENCLIYATGPVMGFMRLAGGRWRGW